MPKGYVDNKGRFIYQIPDEFRIFLPSNFLMGWVIYKGGLDSLIREGHLCPENAKQFAKIQMKHRIEKDVQIIEYRFGEKTVIRERWAVVHVKSMSGREEYSYTITYSHLPKKEDDPREIIKSPSRIRVIHQCGRVARRDLTSVPHAVVKEWFPDISHDQYIDRIDMAGNIEFDEWDSHIIAGLIYLANKSPFMADLGILNEKNLEKINPEFRHINKGIYKLSELDRCSKELFQTIGLTDLFNKFKDIWRKETSIQI